MSDLLDTLHTAGLALTLEDGALRVAGPPETRARYLDIIRQHKADLLAALAHGQNPAPEPEKAPVPPPAPEVPPPSRRGRYGPPVTPAQPDPGRADPPPLPELAEAELAEAQTDALAVEARHHADEDARHQNLMASPKWSPNVPRGRWYRAAQMWDGDPHPLRTARRAAAIRVN